MTAWSNESMESSPDSRALLTLSRRVQIEHLETSLVQHETDMADGRLAQEWVEPSGISDLMPRLTPESLTELREVFDRKLEELTARDTADPRARQVVLLMAGLALAPRDSGAARDVPGPAQTPTQTPTPTRTDSDTGANTGTDTEDAS